jgi:sialic acid synthase SpsE
MKIKLGNKIISNSSKTYFIADIAANHDGSLSRAKKLIRLCAKAGADAAKFQHFKAETIVSDHGFKQLGKITHQKKWKNSVFETYKKASIDPKWTPILFKECKKNKIDFLTAPYDLDYVDQVDKYIPAYKIGSGDISWKEIIIKIAKKKKPIFLATGASNFSDVKKTVSEIFKYNKSICLMQCNTNYTNSINNFKNLNLNVLKLYKRFYKERIILGLSDHTPGHLSVIAAVALGARVIEKHFTDNNNRIGPDHKFSMNYFTWKKMVNETRILETAMGDGKKKIEKNERQSIIVQRRGVWLKKNVKKNDKLTKDKVSFLRPCPKDSIDIFDFNKLLGKRFKFNMSKDSLLTKKCLAK